MKDIATLLAEPETTVAVVGATDNPGKYGNVIYRDLKRKGFTVYPVNKNRDTVDGDKAYRSLEDLPQKPTIVNIVVPPREALQTLKKCKELGVDNVWLQPGAESSEVMILLEAEKFNYLANACIMVQSRSKRGAW
jgi:predicted CoA-binding protein